MPKDLNKTFEELLKRYTKAIEKDYKAQYKKANDKEFIVEELTKGTNFLIDWEALDSVKRKPLETFSSMYKRGTSINEILTYIKETYGEVEDIKPYSFVENDERRTIYLSEEEQALKKLALDERKLFKILIRNTAHRAIKKRLPTLFDEVSTKKETKNGSPISWTGSEKNKNEFVQLIYALHQAGFINKGKGEIIKIIETLAGTFGLDLGKNWQSNHSASIHKAKSSYQPPIFDKIKESYLQYAESLIEDKRKTK